MLNPPARLLPITIDKCVDDGDTTTTTVRKMKDYGTGINRDSATGGTQITELVASQVTGSHIRLVHDLFLTTPP